MLVDLRHLLRTLRRSPASAVAAVLTLALTLGAGASIYAVVDAVLLTPPPFTDPDALVAIGERPLDETAGAPRPVTYRTFASWRDRAGAMAALEALDGTNLTLTGLGAAERVSANDVTAGLLALLGAVPERGRGFEAGNLGQPLVIVSHAFWRGRLASDPDVIGRKLVLGSQPHTIIGVLPEPFFFAGNPADFWRPLPLTPAQASLAGYRVTVMGRLANHVSPAALNTALDDISRLSTPPAHANTLPLAATLGGEARRTLGLLAGAAVLAMVIAFANFAGLLIVRSIDRRRELAVRTALGARRSEIARQLVLEAEVLVAVGVAGGVLLALWMTPAFARITLERFGAWANRDVEVSWRVAGSVAAVAAVCAAICGGVPAWLASRRGLVDVLRRGVTPAPRELALRRALVIGEVALAFVLLVCVTLLGASLRRVLAVNPGLDASGVLTMHVSVPVAIYPTPERVASFYGALERAVEERLGPRTASIVNELPLTGDGGRRVVTADGASSGPEAVAREAGPAYFDVMRIPIVEGRPFDSRDGTSTTGRAVVSRTLALRLFGGASPIGRHIRLSRAAADVEIVGVSGDVKHRALDEPVAPTVYLAVSQFPSRSSIVVSRSQRPDADVIAVVREAVTRLDSNLPVYGVSSMREVIARSPGVPARRLLTATFTMFSMLAVALGAIGLFGVVAHDVARRRSELALRIALGADSMRIVRATLAQGAAMVGIGLAAGGLLSLWAARAISSLLFATGGTDVVAIGIAALALGAGGIGAVLPAALRAARTDPLAALRSE